MFSLLYGLLALPVAFAELKNFDLSIENAMVSPDGSSPCPIISSLEMTVCVHQAVVCKPAMLDSSVVMSVHIK